MSRAAVIIATLSEMLATGQCLEPEDHAIAEDVASEAHGEDAAVVRALAGTFAMEERGEAASVASRSPQETREIAASLRVAAAYEHPARTRFVDRVIGRLWSWREGDRRVSPDDIRAAIRDASPDDRAFITALRAGSKAAA